MSGPGPIGRAVAIAERVAAGLLAGVTILTFVSVVLRYLFRWSIPDAYDLGRNLLGVLIFWGIALCGHRGDHITVGLLWGALPRRAQQIVDAAATAFAAACMAVFAWMMGEKVIETQASAETTYDLHLPVWPFQALAWAGLVVSVLLLLLRLWRQIADPDALGASADPASH